MKFKEKANEFLKKKGVMIALVVVAAILAIIYIYVLVRPINYNMAYTANIEGVKMSMTINSSKTMTLKVSDGNTNVSTDIYIITNGSQVGMIGAKGDGSNGTYTEEDYRQAVDEYNALSQTEKDQYWASDQVITMGMFGIRDADTGETFVCGGMIAFVIVMGVVTIGLIWVAEYSYKLYLKTKNAQPVVIDTEPKDNATTGTTTNETIINVEDNSTQTNDTTNTETYNNEENK